VISGDEISLLHEVFCVSCWGVRIVQSSRPVRAAWTVTICSFNSFSNGPPGAVNIQAANALLNTIKGIRMLAVRDHGVDDYAKLPHMDTTDVGVLGEDDRACLEELGQYLAATDAWPRFGVWLLHKHFEPAPGEVFVERAACTAKNENHSRRAVGVRRAGVARDGDPFRRLD
jgi:hypothetical protein